MKTRTRRLLFLLALVLLAAALLWNTLLNGRSKSALLAKELNARYGYALTALDMYPAGAWESRSIRSLFPDGDEIVLQMEEASKASGLPADVDTVGYIELVLINTKQDDVLTLYLLDNTISLGFRQVTGETDIWPLGNAE